MEFLQVIRNRLSVRNYQKKNIKDDQLQYILSCGHAAPTAGNIQPWEFIIVRNLKLKREIVNTTFVGNQELSLTHQEWLMNAPVFIVVCANLNRITNKYGNKMKKLAYLDCSACIENMLLATVDLGLGSCYISGFREKELAKVLYLPEHLEVIAFLPIGYAKGQLKYRKKRPLKEAIHLESYKNLSIKND